MNAASPCLVLTLESVRSPNGIFFLQRHSGLRSNDGYEMKVFNFSFHLMLCTPCKTAQKIAHLYPRHFL